MRILFVTQYFPPEIGATQTRLHEFARAAAERGHSVTVITEVPNHPTGRISPAYRGRLTASETMDGFVVERVWVWTSPVKTRSSRLLFYASFLFAAVLRGLLLRGRVDVVVASSPPLPVGLAGWIIARRHGARFVLDIRDLWPAAAVALGELRSASLLRLAATLERFLYRQADCVTAVTHGFVKAIAPKVRAGREVVYLPNGVSSAILHAPPPTAETRSRLGFGGSFVVMFAGNLGIAQGLSTVIDSANELAGESVLFCFLGDGPAKARLIEESARRGLSNVRFLSPVPPSEVGSYLTAADALLVSLSSAPVFEDFVPSKLFDCLACARPVILLANGEARSILEASEGGIWAPPEDPSALTAAVRSLTRLSAEERAEVGARGASYVRLHYTRAVQNERLVKILEQFGTP